MDVLGAGRPSRGVRFGLWATIGALLVGGISAAITVEPPLPDRATAAELAALRRAPMVVRAEQQISVVQEWSMPAGMKMTCTVKRPLTRCEQAMPAGVSIVTVSTPAGYFVWVPESRRAATGGKEWVQASGGGSASVVDGYVSILGTAKTASHRSNASIDGALADYFRFEMPERSVDLPRGMEGTMQMPADMKMSSVVEAWVDDGSRPLRLVNQMSMKSKDYSGTVTMTFTFTYAPVADLVIPSPSDAFAVASLSEATRLVAG